MFLYNAWYVAAWGTEIGEKPMARTLLEEPVVFYRRSDGQVAALEDRCCHRGMPLSCGQVFGNNIRCEYHGMVFDGGGNCVEVAWRKSSYSAHVQNCVEVAGSLPGAVAVRDSKDPDGPTLVLAPAAWRALARRVKGGELA